MIDPLAAWLRTAEALNRLTRTGMQATETILAAQEVVGVRAGMMNGTTAAARAELARMVPEKVAAFSQAGSAVAAEWLTLQAAWLAETQRMAVAMTGGAPSIEKAETAAVRLHRHGLEILEGTARLADAGLGPIHKGVTANARRLRRKPGSRA